MKLSDIKKISEAVLEVKTAEDLWSENEGSVSEYVSTTTYQVRQIKGVSPVMFEVLSIIGDQAKPYGKFNAIDLAKTLKPIRPNQTPDAEGYTIYTDPLKVEAFQYSGDPCKLELDQKQTAQLNKGDYVTRAVSGSSFKFNTETETAFESSLKKAP